MSDCVTTATLFSVRVVKLPVLGVVLPIAGGLDKLSVPPKVKLPDVVTVPVKVKPLTVPVPLTDVTVPVVELVPAPIAVRNVAASKAEIVLSALNLGKVTAEGLLIVKMFEPRVVAPNDVRPVAATKLVDPPFHCCLSL